ncbi:phage hypothetical protein [Stenotrophomonas virus Jojan60]|jgi:hypothetical protein|nr:phage hypothetical protein [Stenotrophomonas virus Jojan60]
MAIVFRNHDLNHLRTRVLKIPEQIQDAGEELVREHSREGARLMREYIASRGTGYRGHRGRVESGEMLQNVRNTAEREGTHVRARWGWLDRQENYYRWQEQGFYNWRSESDVEPMHALLDSFIQQREHFIRDVMELVKK